MLKLDWITDDEYKEAYKQAEQIADNFMVNKFMEGEEITDEIWVGNKAFDVTCYEEEFDDSKDKRTSPVHVTLYATKETDDGCRYTDDWNSIDLFTVGCKSCLS